MPTDRKKQPTARKKKAATASPKPAADVVYVAYKGTSDLRIPAPGHGHTYVFQKLPVRNAIPTSVWEEISDERSGKAAVYIRRRVLRKVGKGDSFTKRVEAKAIPIAQANLPQVSAVSASDTAKDLLIADLQRNLANLNRQIQDLLAKPVRPAPEPEDFDDAEDDGDDEPSEDGGLIDPSDFNGKTIKRALDGLGLEDLEAVKDSEERGKNRPAVLKVIEAAIDAALAAEEQG